jgi:aspartyl-tRNA synthetase
LPKENHMPHDVRVGGAVRTDYCAELGSDDVGRRVIVAGWVARRRLHGENLAFIDVRDRSGILQCVVGGTLGLGAEDVVLVEGDVSQRPEGTRNYNIPSGAIELQNCTVTVLSKAKPLPFAVIDERAEPNESVRFRYRYLDLRRQRPADNLRLRATTIRALRLAMEAEGFIEVETPLLWSPTPEGAREFLVPSRLRRGNFYALPQSPQLAKQLLMVAGMDRYYQFARCARDEDLRADRQFEFTQLDIEASFVGATDIIRFIERAVRAAVLQATGIDVGPIPVITWQESMERFGTDKPDMRLEPELTDLAKTLAGSELPGSHEPCIKGLRIPSGAAFSRKQLDQMVSRARSLGAAGLTWIKFLDAGSQSSAGNRLSEDRRTQIGAACGAGVGDLVVVVAGEQRTVSLALGGLRTTYCKPRPDAEKFAFVWVVDFPLFEGFDNNNRPIPAHHPFTSPHPEDLHLLEEDPLAVRSLAYDLVLNDWEMGSGSVRIHDQEVQQRIFELLGMPQELIDARFGFLLEAFRYGVPPHAGFALGVDRLVTKLAGEDNVRELIAFPKTSSGQDPVTSSPQPASAEQLDQLGLSIATAAPDDG